MKVIVGAGIRRKIWNEEQKSREVMKKMISLLIFGLEVFHQIIKKKQAIVIKGCYLVAGH